MWHDFKQTYLIKFWSPMPTVIAMGILSVYFFGLTGSTWAITGELTRWGGHALQLLGFQPENWQYFQMIKLKGTPLDRVGGMMLIGMFGGCMAAALWANNVKFRMPQSRRRVMQALVGGIIAGFGARLAVGCNLGAFFTGIPQFSLHAWFFALALAAGSYIGAKVCLMPYFRAPIKLNKTNKATQLTQNTRNVKSHFRLGIILFVVLCIISFALISNSPRLGFAMLLGIAFGLAIERAQICFTSAFRDMWITGRTHMAKAIIIGMAVSAIGIYCYLELGMSPKIRWAGPNAVIGGLMFGFGIVLAGGCETGWMYRAVEGQVHFWWVGIGNIIGATILAYYWDALAEPLATNWDKINLLTEFGPAGGLGVTYLLLALSFGLILLWEKQFFAKKAKQNQQIINKQHTLSPIKELG